MRSFTAAGTYPAASGRPTGGGRTRAARTCNSVPGSGLDTESLAPWTLGEADRTRKSRGSKRESLRAAGHSGPGPLLLRSGRGAGLLAAEASGDHRSAWIREADAGLLGAHPHRLEVRGRGPLRERGREPGRSGAAGVPRDQPGREAGGRDVSGLELDLGRRSDDASGDAEP